MPGDTDWWDCVGSFLQAIASLVTHADWWDFFFFNILCWSQLDGFICTTSWTAISFLYRVACSKVVRASFLFLLWQKRPISKTSAIRRPEDREPRSPVCYDCRSKAAWGSGYKNWRSPELPGRPVAGGARNRQSVTWHRSCSVLVLWHEKVDAQLQPENHCWAKLAERWFKAHIKIPDINDIFLRIAFPANRGGRSSLGKSSVHLARTREKQRQRAHPARTLPIWMWPANPETVAKASLKKKNTNQKTTPQLKKPPRCSATGILTAS